VTTAHFVHVAVMTTLVAEPLTEDSSWMSLNGMVNQLVPSIVASTASVLVPEASVPRTSKATVLWP
jgi:hypothetical protein